MNPVFPQTPIYRKVSPPQNTGILLYYHSSPNYIVLETRFSNYHSNNAHRLNHVARIIC